MEIKRAKPIARGVSHLMYVGDDASVESACTSSPGDLMGAVLGGVLAWRTNGNERYVWLGVAGYFAAKLWRSRGG